MFTQAQAILGLFTRRSDILLAVSVVMILFMIIVPLPTLALDALIAVNMTAGMILLMVAVYIPSPLAFSVFPAILLITTLFRLALNISSTRLILLDGDAGEIILAFGEFVVGDNFVVGAVLFLIITIVQFVVITKGSMLGASLGDANRDAASPWPWVAALLGALLILSSGASAYLWRRMRQSAGTLKTADNDG